MFLVTIGSHAWTAGGGDGLSPADRQFILTAIRSALLSRHPELRSKTNPDAVDGLGVLDLNLEAFIAVVQCTMVSGPPADANELLDEHVCPHCIYNTPSGGCEMRCTGAGAGTSAPARACTLRRYGPTIFHAASDALLKLAGGGDRGGGDPGGSGCEDPNLSNRR